MTATLPSLSGRVRNISAEQFTSAITCFFNQFSNFF